MGMGDEIIATGEARHAQEKWEKVNRTPPPKVLIKDLRGRPRWHPLWQNNPRLAHPGYTGNIIEITHGGRCRPYIDYNRMKQEWPWPERKYDVTLAHPRTPWRFTAAKVQKGELYITRKPTVPGRVIIEPYFKAITPNRNWGWDKYAAVVEAFPEIQFVQINPAGMRLLPGVHSIPAANPMMACKMISSAQAYLGPEGGLYHAAAALDVPAVAIFGGYVSPANQGYEDPRYINLYEDMDGESPCGMRTTCEHCQKAMEKITVERVIRELRWLLNLGK